MDSLEDTSDVLLLRVEQGKPSSRQSEREIEELTDQLVVEDLLVDLSSLHDTTPSLYLQGHACSMRISL